MSSPSDFSAQELPSRTRVRFGLVTALIGFSVLVIGAKPGWFGWDNSSAVGFVQIFAMLLGLGVLTLGGFISLLALWKGTSRTIAADIGMRLVSTGYVIAIFAAMADLFGMGTETGTDIMHFGLLQARGIVIGEIVIAIGFLLMIPYRTSRPENKQDVQV